MAVLLPPIRQRFFTSNGKPLVGGKIWTYVAGTTTPISTYLDPDLTPNTNPIILDADGYCDIWLKPGSYKFVLMDANDVVQYTVDKVRPADGGGGGMSDADYIYSGFSARFNEIFNTTGLADTLDKIIKLTYTPPGVSLAASENVLREKGVAVTSTTLTAAISKRSNNIAQVRFYQGAGLLSTITSPNPAGGNETYSWSGIFSDNTTFSVQVDDVSGDGGPTTVSSSTTFNFVYPYFHGSDVSSALTAAQVATKEKTIQLTSNNISRTFTVTPGDYIYFAQPSSYTALTAIFDVSNFDVTASWQMSTGNYTANDGTTQTLRVYKLINPVGAGPLTFRFTR